MRIRYDPVGDILYISRVMPYAEQGSDEVAEGVVVRTNPETTEVESVEIQGFVARGRAGESFELPTPLQRALSA
jgi:hypothetical protein